MGRRWRLWANAATAAGAILATQVIVAPCVAGLSTPGTNEALILVANRHLVGQPVAKDDRLSTGPEVVRYPLDGWIQTWGFGAENGRQDEVHQYATHLGGPAAPPTPAETTQSLMETAKVREAAGKKEEAVRAYEEVLKRPRLADTTAADAAERILALSGVTRGAEASEAFARGIWEEVNDGEAVTRVKMALARVLVRLGRLDDAQRVLSEVTPAEAGKVLEKRARELIGEELVKIGDEAAADRKWDAAAAAYKTAVVMARSGTHRSAGQKGYVAARISAGQLDEALRVAEDYIDGAQLEPEKAGAILLKIQVLLAKNDLKGARACVDSIDQLKKAYQYHRVTSRIMVGKHVLAQARVLESEGKTADAYEIYEALLGDANTPGETVNRASERKLALMPKVLKAEDLVAECDRMSADKRLENLGNCVLHAKMNAQLRLGRRDDARGTAALLLAHPNLYASQKTAVEKEFGSELPKTVMIDDAQFSGRVKGFEKTIHSSAAAAARADACRSLLRLYSWSGRTKEAEKRARELLEEVEEPYPRQSIRRELYDIQLRLDDIEGALNTARAMIGQLASRNVPDRLKMRELADEVIGDLANQLRTRNQLRRGRDLLAELNALLGNNDLPSEEGSWCRQRMFAIHLALGDTDAALAFYRENVDALSAVPANLPPIVSALTKAAETKLELADDAVASAGKMTAAVISADPKTAAALRSASASALAELTRFLGAHGQKEKAAGLLVGLVDGLAGKKVDEDGRTWCVEMAFDGWCRLEEPVRAVGVLKENLPAFKRATNAVPEALLKAAASAGKEPRVVTAEDIALGAAWYLEKNANGLDTAYAGTVFNAVVQAYTNEGHPAEAGRFIEKTVRGATARQRNAEDWKYRAAQIYLDANMLAEARRAAEELQAQWPASRDKGQLLLARIEAADDPDASARRITALPKSFSGPELLLTGKHLIAAYEKRQEWAKAASVYEQLAARINSPLDKQALHEGLYGMQMKSNDVDGAVLSARSLVAMSVSSQDAKAVPAVRAAATRVMSDLSKELTRRRMTAKAAPLLEELTRAGQAAGLDEDGKSWVFEHTFNVYAQTGNTMKAIRFLRENAAVIRKAPGDLGGAVYTAAQMADKAEMQDGRPVTMGTDAGSGVLDDVFFAADWFFRNDTRQGPIYAEAIFRNLEDTGKRQGNLVPIAEFLEKTVRIASPDRGFQEKWGCRAAQMYFDARDYKEARRALAQVQKTWPAQWEKTELLLAKIDVSESSPTAGERLRRLYARAKDSGAWFESGDELVRLYQAQGEWAKAVALQQELGARDPRRLFTWAYDYQKKKRFEEALPLYEQYTKNSPTDYRGHSFPAACLVRLKRCPEAVALYDAAAQYFEGPNRESATLSAASVFLDDLRQYAEAERRFRAFTAAYPSSRDISGAWGGLIRSLCGLGRFDEAADLSRRKLAEAGEDPGALSFRMLLSESLSGQGKGAEALAVLDEAVVKHGLDRANLSPWMMIDFALAHKAAGDSARAAALADEVLRRCSDDERACERARELLR